MLNLRKIYIFLPTVGKLYDRLSSLSLVWQLISEKETSDFTPFKFCKKIDFLSHPAGELQLIKHFHVIFIITWSHIL